MTKLKRKVSTVSARKCKPAPTQKKKAQAQIKKKVPIRAVSKKIVKKKT